MNPLIIEAGKSEAGYWRDLWRFRELLFFFSWRDFLVRYKQTVFGVLWAFVRPLLTVFVFVIIFRKLANVPSDGLPYAVMVTAGTLPWMFFSSGLSEASFSLNANSEILTKVYFPRLMCPASAILVTLVDYAISLVILIGMLAAYRVVPNWQVLLLPLFSLLAMVACFGASLWFSALNVKYRDFRYLITFVLQLGFYITPVGFPSEVLRQRYGEIPYHIFCLNPMVGVINAFRWSLGGNFNVAMDWGSLWISLGVVVALSISGLLYFRATEDSFADIV